MNKKALAELKKLDPKARVKAMEPILFIAVIFVVALIFIYKPDRSVASYCKVYREENAKLAKSQGDSYSVKVFDHSSSNPADIAAAFHKLDSVAPKEIEPDVKTLEDVFQNIESNPANAIGASLSGISAESSVTSWTKNNCNL